MNTELIEHQTITMIVDNVEQAKAEIKQAFDILRTAKKRLDAVIGPGGQQILGYQNYYGDSAFEERSLGDSERRITQNAWRYILAQTGLNHYMTAKRQEELHKQIEGNELPPLTVENIVGTIQGLAGKIDGLLMESVKEVFDWLRPRKHLYRNAQTVGDLKTNHEFHVGYKVIVSGCEYWYRGWRIDHYRENQFRSLGNVFSLMDGKGVQKYPDDLVTQINTALQDSRPYENVFENDYFHCRLFLNGRVHIKFKRHDLVDKLNQLAGGNDLPGKEEI